MDKFQFQPSTTISGWDTSGRHIEQTTSYHTYTTPSLEPVSTLGGNVEFGYQATVSLTTELAGITIPPNKPCHMYYVISSQ